MIYTISQRRFRRRRRRRRHRIITREFRAYIWKWFFFWDMKKKVEEIRASK